MTELDNLKSRVVLPRVDFTSRNTPQPTESSSPKQVKGQRRGSIAKGSSSRQQKRPETPGEQSGVVGGGSGVGAIGGPVAGRDAGLETAGIAGVGGVGVTVHGAGLVLPTLQDGAESPELSPTPSATRAEVLLPILLGPAANKHAKNKPIYDSLSLEIAGQDLQLPKPRLHIPEPQSSQQVPVGNMFKGYLRLDLEDVREEDEIYDEYQDVEDAGSEVIHSLKQVLKCHAIGIPVEIVKVGRKRRGRYARPLFHCHTCLQRWRREGNVLDNCPEEANPVRGPVINLTSNAAKFLKAVWTKHLRDRISEDDEVDWLGGIRESRKVNRGSGDEKHGVSGGASTQHATHSPPSKPVILATSSTIFHAR